MQNEDVKGTLDFVIEQLEQNVQMVDLTQLEFKISRARTSPTAKEDEAWTDTTFGFENLQHLMLSKKKDDEEAYKKSH